ncbi:hypothetical protein RB601_005750 [Gaeumannomyces tritici]
MMYRPSAAPLSWASLLLAPAAVAAMPLSAWPTAAAANSTLALAPASPELTFLYTINITGGAAIPVGAGPRGSRVVLPIMGGTFAGPHMRGRLLPVGADWALVDARDGVLTADVRQTLETDDGEHVLVFETGATHVGAFARAVGGGAGGGGGQFNASAPTTACLRIAFETGSQRYYWLNSVVAVGVLRRLSPTQLTIDAWQITPPQDTTVLPGGVSSTERVVHRPWGGDM